VPYLAHMTMEPQSCVAKVTADSCHVQGGLQQPDYARDLAAKLTGLPPERVRVDVTFAGGGFGRRWELDSVQQAVSIAKAVPGRAVNLIWTREQDLQHDFYRPAYMARYRARLDRSGNVLAVHGRIAGQSLLGYKRMRPNPKFPDGSSAFGVIPAEYDLPNALCDSVDVAVPVPVGFWRAVGASQNGFFAESMIDELAHAARRDPLEFRRSLVRSNPRALAVLERAAAESGWGTPLRKGRGRGFAMNTGFGSVCAQVFEVTVDGSTVTIDKVTCVYDCGLVLNPGTVEAQLEGGISWGLCAALNGEIGIAAGRVQQGNFHEQSLLRINEMPHVRVALMDSAERIGGVGEGSVPPVAAALCNAIFAATGRRYRSLPLRKQGLEFTATRT
jgi:isoquinoline 1-oxidoreductase beta subunit